MGDVWASEECHSFLRALPEALHFVFVMKVPVYLIVVRDSVKGEKWTRRWSCGDASIQDSDMIGVWVCGSDVIKEGWAFT